GDAFAASSGAGEVLVPVAVLVAGPFDHELRSAGAVEAAFEVVVVLLGPFAFGVLRVELGLHPQPRLGVDERVVGAVVGHTTVRDGAVVVGVGEDLVQPGRRDGLGRLGRRRPGGQPAGLELAGE